MEALTVFAVAVAAPAVLAVVGLVPGPVAFGLGVAVLRGWRTGR